MISLVCRDMHKSGGYQRARRTAAMASLKVGSRLSYHAAVRGRTAPIGERTIRFAQTVTKENNPSSAGVVRRIGEIGPLPLRLHAEMGPRFLKRCLHAPT